MYLLDANILIYSVDSNSSFHKAARSWLEDVLHGPEHVGFCWQTIFAFLRIITSAKVFVKPLSGEQAIALVNNWLAQPRAEIVEPGSTFLEIVGSLLKHTKGSGAFLSDLYLAALAHEQGAVICSNDTDFARFDGFVKVLDPLTA